jgi:multiple sugar transport system permease protein
VVLRDEWKLPVAVRLYQLEGAYVKEWGPMMASYAISAVPLVIVFLFSMKFFVKGLSSGAIKG